MHSKLQLLLAVVLVSVVVISAGKSHGEGCQTDVLDQSFYGLDAGEQDGVESDGIEENEVKSEDTTTPFSGRGRFRGPPRSRGKGRHSHKGKPWQKPMSPDEKFDFICRAIKTKTNNGPSRRMATKLQAMDPEVREQFQAALALRTAAMSECCVLTDGAQRSQCADNLRDRRYTRVCSGEEPLNIWSLLKGKGGSTQTSETVTKCCELQDAERRSCFLESKQKPFGRFHGKHRRPRD